MANWPKITLTAWKKPIIMPILSLLHSLGRLDIGRLMLSKAVRLFGNSVFTAIRPSAIEILSRHCSISIWSKEATYSEWFVERIVGVDILVAQGQQD